jgi:DNA-binding beta-propeller fold protein YncE
MDGVWTLAGQVDVDDRVPMDGHNDDATFVMPTGIAVHSTTGIVYVTDGSLLRCIHTNGMVSLISLYHQSRVMMLRRRTLSNSNDE